jgi:hypothetical protein
MNATLKSQNTVHKVITHILSNKLNQLNHEELQESLRVDNANLGRLR